MAASTSTRSLSELNGKTGIITHLCFISKLNGKIAVIAIDCFLDYVTSESTEYQRCQAQRQVAQQTEYR